MVVAENASGFPVAFMGVEGQRLEMLFILPTERGKGLGKTLLQCGIKDYSVNELAVNEQNPLAKGFYEHMGFIIVGLNGEEDYPRPSFLNFVPMLTTKPSPSTIFASRT